MSVARISKCTSYACFIPCSIALIIAALLYFFFVPFGYEPDPVGMEMGSSSGAVELQCRDLLPATIYISLAVVLLLQVLVTINEVCIFIVSSQGTVLSDRPRRWIPGLLYVRIGLFLVDMAALIVTSWALLDSHAFAMLETCPPYITALRFSQAIVAVIWLTLLIYGVGFLLYIGPACFFDLNKKDMPSFVVGVELSDQDRSARKLWKKAYRGTVETRRIARHLRKGSSLICIRDNVATTSALEHLAFSLFRVFRNVGLVPSDILAGFLVLQRDQKKKIRRGGVRELTIPLREVSIDFLIHYQSMHVAWCFGNNYNSGVHLR